MVEILGAILEAIGYILNIQGLVQAIQGNQAEQAKQDTLSLVESEATIGTNAVTNPISGTAAIWQLLGAIQSGTAPSLTTIADLIAALTPTTLPATPPEAWGGELAPGFLSAPLLMPWWQNTILERGLDVALYEMEANLMGMTGAKGWPSRKAPDFAVCGYDATIMWGAVWREGGSGEMPMPLYTDWTDWDGIETLVEFLTRSHPSFDWNYNAIGGYWTPGIAWGRLTGWSEIALRCLVRESDLPMVSGRLWAAVSGLSVGLPPVWPGLANVVLGTPVALDQGVHVDGPMHGALLDITDMEKLIPFGTMGDFHTFRNLGRFAFTNDDGWQEDWTGVPSLHAQLMPKQMSSAGGLDISFYTGVTGSVTPFTIVSA